MKSLALYFAGAEVPTWRKLLASEGVPHIGINYLHLKPRITRRPWLLEDHFPSEQKIFLDSGAAGVNKKRWSLVQHEEYLAEYLDFVQDNLDRLTYFTECDFLHLGLDWVQSQRDVWFDLAPDQFVPVWHEEWGAALARTMVERYTNLGVPQLSESAQNSLGALIRSSRVALHGLGFSHPWDTPGGLYSTIVSGSWISPMRFGETVVWDTNRLRRYPAEEKERARRRHRSAFSRAGFDANKIAADDSTEIARYTIWAWRQLEEHMAPPEHVRIVKRREIATNNGSPRENGNGEISASPVAHNGSPTQGNGSHLPDVLRPLPVFNFRPVTTQTTSPEGQTVDVTAQVAVMSQAPLRQCASCSLAMACPEFEAGASCKFSIPVEIRTREQLMGILHSLLEMQGQRIAFGFFSEQLQGGYPDANISAELDRFMRMTTAVKEIEDNRDFFKVSIEGRGQTGVLRRLFGAERAETLHRVDADKAENAVRRTMEP